MLPNTTPEPHKRRTTTRRQVLDTVALVTASTAGILTGMVSPTLGVIAACAVGGLFGAVTTSIAAAAISLLAAKVIKLGISSVTNPAYLVAAVVGLSLGFYLRHRFRDDPEIE